MPVYDRKCLTCDELYEVTCKISEKDTIKPECPNCGSQSGDWMLSATAFSMRGDRFMHTTEKRGFNEVLRNISAKNPGTPINDYVA